MATPSESVVSHLSVVLASTYTLYVKTHNYHWNVTGPMFNTLHTLFEAQYTELATSVDELAERIRALGAYAPGSFAAFGPLSVVAEETDHPEATAMIGTLVADHRAVAEAARRLIEVAEAKGDAATADLGTRRVDVHDKQAWMLGSHLAPS